MLVEKEILDKAIAALQKQTGLQKESYSRFNGRDQSVDYELLLCAPQETEPRKFWAKVKKNISGATISEAVFQSAQAAEKFVLVAEYVSQPQAEKLRELGVSFCDTAGNAYFNEPGLYIFVTGQKAQISREKIPRLFRPPGMKLLYAFLTDANLENQSYRSISAATNVPTPTVGVFMADLEKAGFLVKRGGNERRIVRRHELLKRWLENYGESFRPTLEPIRFRSKKYDGRWWEEVDLTKYNACWGGETGGAILTKHLKPAVATIYSDSLLPRLQAQYGLIRDAHGNVEILKKFWTQGETENTAPPLVVYADLVATADGRNLETAQIIYDRYLADIAEKSA